MIEYTSRLIGSCFKQPNNDASSHGSSKRMLVTEFSVRTYVSPFVQMSSQHRVAQNLYTWQALVKTICKKY